MVARIDRMWGASSYQDGMMQAVLLGQTFQMQRVWTEDYRNTGTFHALVISGTHVAILAAFFLFILRVCFVPESLALLMTSLAWRAGKWMGIAMRPLGGRADAVYDRQLFLSRPAAGESAGGGCPGLSPVRPGTTVRSQLPTHISGRGVSGAFAMPFIAATTGLGGARFERLGRYRPRPAPGASRGPVPHRNALAGRNPTRRAAPSPGVARFIVAFTGRVLFSSMK